MFPFSSISDHLITSHHLTPHHITSGSVCTRSQCILAYRPFMLRYVPPEVVCHEACLKGMAGVACHVAFDQLIQWRVVDMESWANVLIRPRVCLHVCMRVYTHACMHAYMDVIVYLCIMYACVRTCLCFYCTLRAPMHASSGAPF